MPQQYSITHELAVNAKRYLTRKQVRRLFPRRYRIVAEGFRVFVLSHRIGALKPDPVIYRAAAEMAGCAPAEIFFVDDIAGHVVGAKAVGFDAVQFTTAEALAEELRQRAVRFNY